MIALELKLGAGGPLSLSGSAFGFAGQDRIPAGGVADRAATLRPVQAFSSKKIWKGAGGILLHY